MPVDAVENVYKKINKTCVSAPVITQTLHTNIYRATQTRSLSWQQPQQQ